jgi:hypothetical protein
LRRLNLTLDAENVAPTATAFIFRRVETLNHLLQGNACFIARSIRKLVGSCRSAGIDPSFANDAQLIFSAGIQNDVSSTPLPATLPLFATGLGALGLFGWRRKRMDAAAISAA